MKTVSFLALEAFSYQLEPVISLLRSDYRHQVEFIPQSDLNESLDRFSLNTDLIVTVHSIGDGLSEFLNMARNSGILSLTIQDGIIEHCHAWLKPRSRNFYRPILTDKIAVMGSFSRDILIAWGAEPNSIAITGLPRMDYLPEIPAPFGDSLLLTCANTPFYDDDTKMHFKQFMMHLINELETRHIDYVARLPKSVYELLEYRIPKESYSDSSDRRSLREDLSRSSAVLTTMSTVALEAMACHRPTAIINPENMTQYFHTPWTISSTDQASTVISELLSVPAEKMIFQNYVLGQHLRIDNSSTDRVCQLINTMLLES